MSIDPSFRPRARRAAVIAVAAATAIGSLALAGGSASAVVRNNASTPGWPVSADWQKYVQSPTSSDVRPVSVVRTSGDVTNAGALLDPSSGQSTTLTATPQTIQSSPVSIDVATQARYLRLDVTKLGLPASNDTGGHYTQLAEVQVFGADGSVDLAQNKPVTANDSLENFGWGSKYLTDGVTDTQSSVARGWTTNIHTDADLGSNSVWATIDLGSVTDISSVVLWPRTDTLSTDGQTASFPVDYTIKTSSTDASDSSFATQKTVTDQTDPPAPVMKGAASIVLDYGHDVGGFPIFDVSASEGDPTLQAGYSETLTQIGPEGDGVSPWASGDSKRFDTYHVTGPGRITNPDIQGGERYEQITLTTPGSLTLTGAGIQFTPPKITADTLTGNFESSSDALNKFWYNGVYTAQLNQVPTNSIGQHWTTSAEGLDVPGTSAGVGLLTAGSGWTDYTASFSAKIVTTQAGWMVRGHAAQKGGYLMILGSAGTTNVLQEVYQGADGGYQTIATVPLPMTIQLGSWYDITEVVSGSTVTTSINGTEVASFDSSTFGAGRPAFSAGSVGFRQFSGEEGMFKNLTVTGPGGDLYSNTLTDSSAVADFDVPGNNAVPLILDGAKRDRAVWSGDLAVEGPTLYYSSDSADYIRGSLELLGSWAGSNGYMPGSMPPQTPLNTEPPSSTRGGYSANYSMYFVRALADYYQYTGDTAFVQKEWPLVVNELAWNASQMGPNGLFVTDSSTGADWDYYDGSKTGEVTAFNALYYKILTDGATLAAAVGQPDQGQTYSNQAVALKDAINSKLFNSQTGVYNLSSSVTNVVAQDANVLAIDFGIAPADKVQGILDSIKSSLWTSAGTLPFSSGYQETVSPFVSGFELNARFGSGNTSDALQLLSNEWGPMIAPGDLYTGTFWENLNTSGTQAAPNTNMAHGWSTMPVSALSKYVLGIQPVSAGYATWLVQPHTGDLAWTKGQAPTPHGPVVVNWSHGTGSDFAMHVEAPAQTSGTIAVPTFGGDADIRVNGQTVFSHGAPVAGTSAVQSAALTGDYVNLTVAAGTYDIATAPASDGTGVTTPPVDPSTPGDSAGSGSTITPGTAGSSGGSNSSTTAGGSNLANTGFTPWRYLAGAVLLFSSGAVLVVSMRRRRRSA
ncbi:alpha-L-rhamnosidase C-terminal domain-containing protein [Subtercola sp. RTI3]|uniref:alpha-L-rhamnosidase-related protein n=1 Tax=Subtercola sp. RTI3 TaxID=3048639 RepID=UPI002B23EBBD|nr:alpha-L-rhamnosidase C-terminal domain-containing protein [Subtercola sp. RTI3]MEA9984302.1 alpha-L-rhamnosidase C-terminal domain-containing protein [Subtercola sp. RTI3]